MIESLIIAGIIVIVISVITAFMSGSFLGFFLALVGGISTALIFFALSQILSNQNELLARLQYQNEVTVSQLKKKKKVCPNCNYNYDQDYGSCPNCGYRP